MAGIVVRNTLVTYDREHEKVGFWKTNCSELWERLHVSPASPPLPSGEDKVNSTADMAPELAPTAPPLPKTPGLLCYYFFAWIIFSKLYVVYETQNRMVYNLKFGRIDYSGWQLGVNYFLAWQGKGEKLLVKLCFFSRSLLLLLLLHHRISKELGRLQKKIFVIYQSTIFWKLNDTC